VFFDEMDSIFPRGSGVSSDVENTDRAAATQRDRRCRGLENVIVIGAVQPLGLIDPAILRPAGWT